MRGALRGVPEPVQGSGLVGALCSACHLPLAANARENLAAETLGQRMRAGKTEHDVSCWTCEACGLPAWGWDWDDDGE